MEWIVSNALASFALVISFASAYFSYQTHRRNVAAEQPICWLELTALLPDVFLATIHFVNRTPYAMRASKLSVPIVEIPVGKKQDFVLVEYDSALEPDDYGNSNFSAAKIKASARHLAMPLAGTVAAGERGTFHAILVRGDLSTAKQVSISLSMEVLGQRVTHRRYKLEANIPGGGITFVLK